MISVEEKVVMDRLDAAIGFKTGRIRRLSVIAKLADKPEWKALKEEIELTIKGHEGSLKLLAQGHGTPQADRDDFRSLARFYGGQILAFEGVVHNVEQAKEKIERLNQEIAQHREEFRNLRNKTGKASPRTTGGIV